MPQPPNQPSQGSSIPLAQASHLLTTFTHFLTVCIHNILYYRNIYPAQTFLTSRAYNLPVHQSRHPKVCSWIRDAVDALKAQLVLGSVERIAVVLYDDKARVMERWMFDVAGFPAWAGFTEGKVQRREEDEEDASSRAEAAAGLSGVENKVNWSNVHEELRASIRKLAHAGEKMASLPEGCTFTIAVELREEGEAPIGVRMEISYFMHVLPANPGYSTRNLGSQRSRIYKLSLRISRILAKISGAQRQRLCVQ